ncbi:MAG: serpin family protein [Clostridia bacterium]|nr:serpin family protein [Clostridia bacterium]
MNKKNAIINRVKRMVALLLCALMLAAFGCNGGAKNPTASFRKLSAAPRAKDEVEIKQPDETFTRTHAAFMIDIFKNGLKKGENSLVSPVSVLTALAMTANGARGETLSEMRKTLSRGLEGEELNAYLAAYLEQIVNDESAKIEIANSIWFRENAVARKANPDAPQAFTPNKEFLQTNADIFGADIYAAPFNKATVNEINNWVNEKTDGMIDGIIEELDPLAVMQIINALTFDAEWRTKYTKEDQISKGEFTAYGGRKRNVKFMFSEEKSYIQFSDAEGFIKPYKGGRFAFMALLPNEGVDIYDFIDGLNGENLLHIIDNARERAVYAKMPKFSFEYEVSLVDALKAMGMQTAFDAKLADFSGLGESVYGNIAIANVLHKTYIEVGEQGTRAGAVTSVMPAPQSAAEAPVRITLDRPFMFAIIDMQTRLPLFIGALTDPS